MKSKSDLKYLMLSLVFPISQMILLVLYLSHSAAEGFAPPVWLSAGLLLIGCILSDVALWFAFKTIHESAEKAAAVDVLEQRVAANTEYYRKLTTEYEHLRVLRHDYANHSHTLRILVEQKRYDEALAYVKELEERETPVC